MTPLFENRSFIGWLSRFCFAGSYLNPVLFILVLFIFGAKDKNVGFIVLAQIVFQLFILLMGCVCHCFQTKLERLKYRSLRGVFYGFLGLIVFGLGIFLAIVFNSKC
jgi:hypothetical protein